MVNTINNLNVKRYMKDQVTLLNTCVYLLDFYKLAKSSNEQNMLNFTSKKFQVTFFNPLMYGEPSISSIIVLRTVVGSL